MLLGAQNAAMRSPERQFKFQANVRGGVVACLLVASVGFVSGAQAHNPHDPVLGFDVSPNYGSDKTLYVSTFAELNWGYKDIFRSTDGGATWSKLPTGLDNVADISAIRVSPAFAVDGRVYAGTRGSGVYESTDRGNSWHVLNTGLKGLSIDPLAIAGSKTSSPVLFAAPTIGGLFRRADGDTSWKQVVASTTRVPVVAASPDFASDATVIMADSVGALRKSTDAGVTWNSMGSAGGKIVYSIAVAPGGAKEMFVGTSGTGIYYSNDGGKTFSNKLANLPAEAINNVAVSPNYLNDHTVFCTTPTHSVFKSTDRGNSWTLYSSGAEITKQTTLVKEFSGLQVSNNYANDGAVFLPTFGGLFASTTGGTTWSELQTRKNIVTGLAFSPNYAQDKRVMLSSYSGGGLYSSADGGANWSRVWDGWLSWGILLSAFDIRFVPNHVGAPTAVAIRNYQQLGYTSDFGASWSVLDIPTMANDIGAVSQVYPTVIGLSPRFDQDQQIFLGTRRHGLLQSFDGGKSWRVVSSVPQKSLTMSVAVSHNYDADHTVFASTSAGEVWRSVNGGDNWTQVGVGVFKSRVGNKFTWVAMSPNFVDDKFVMVGTNSGVYRSTDRGDNWQQYIDSDIGPNSVVQQIEFSPNFVVDKQVFVNVRGRGLFRLTMKDDGTVASSHNVGAALLANNVEFTELQFSPSYAQDGTILGLSRRDVYRSTDSGDTWKWLGALGDQ